MHVHPALRDLALVDRLPDRPGPLPPSELACIAAAFGWHEEVWQPLVEHDPDQRWFELLVRNRTVEVWLLGWTPGQRTRPHDHGDANGALTVVQGSLVEEVYWDPRLTRLERFRHNTGASAIFGSRHIHRVSNEGRVNATSIHAYSPPGLPMRSYGRTVEEMLEQARAQLGRLLPAEAAAELEAGALLVDIRPEAQRRAEGTITGAVAIDRNVLEWRLDPDSAWHIPEVRDYARRIIVFCSGGYASSQAAASLQQLGLGNATDMVGGFRAWAAAGLPVAAATEHGSALTDFRKLPGVRV